MVRVEGTITCARGSWPARGTLYFTPVEPAPGFPARPGWADFEPDGRFTATSFAPGDGLMPGRYHIGIECWAQPPAMGSKTPPKSAVPAKYQSPATSGLELDIKPGQGKATVQWDVPKT